MATLELRPPQSEGMDLPQDAYNFIEETSIFDTSDVLKPKISSVIHHTNHSTVYRAKLGKIDVVIKFARCSRPVEDLEKESNAYQNELLDLQDDCVPHFRGFFRSKDRKANSIAGCIVLDYCGEKLQELLTLPLCEKIKIMESVGKVHRTGLILRNFAPSNVLRLGDSDRYTLIDFHNVRRHVCYWDGNLRAGQTIPTLWDMCCMNISHLCLEMKIWEPRWPVIDIKGYEYNNLGSYPDQGIVAQLLPEKFTNRARNRKVLLQWLAEFRTLQENDPNPPSIDEYKKTMPTLPIPYEPQL